MNKANTYGSWRKMSWGQTFSISNNDLTHTIATINPDGDSNMGIASREDAANADLIVSAPDLLAVVKNLVVCMDAEPNAYHPVFIASAKAALKKALGE